MNRLGVKGSEFSKIILTNRCDDWAQRPGNRRFCFLSYFVTLQYITLCARDSFF